MKHQTIFLAELQAELAGGMGSQLHWFPEDVQVTRLASVLAGMANTDGGVVWIGISPRSAHIQGVTWPDAVIDQVFQAALLTDPPLVLPVPQTLAILDAESGPVVRIHVPAGLPHVFSLDGRFLGREGAQTNPLSARRLRQLLLERGVVQFETQIPPNATLADLDPQKVSAYVAALSLPEPVGGEQETDPGNDAPYGLPLQHIQILVQRGCLLSAPRWHSPGHPQPVEISAQSVGPTYAALLLFGRYPQQWLSGATILAARFTGITFSDQFIKQDIRGTLPEQLHQAEAFVHTHIRRVVRMVGLEHQETAEYPFEAVRELLVNAVAHRDYNRQGDSIHLNIFADRIEIQSPGGLPGPVTLENLLDARFSRNAVLVQTLSDLGYVERLGYGLDRVMTVLRQNGLRNPRFDEVAGSFRVTLWSELDDPQVQKRVDLSVYQHLSLNPRQESLLAFLSRRRRITNREYQDLCPDVHPETLRRDLADLVGRGVLIKIGDKRATYYILK